MHTQPPQRGEPRTGADKIFAEITFGGEKCPATIKGKQPVKGEQICTWLEPGVDLKGHLLECTEAGSKLKLGANEAKLLDLAEVHMPKLEETDFWDVALS